MYVACHVPMYRQNWTGQSRWRKTSAVKYFIVIVILHLVIFLANPTAALSGYKILLFIFVTVTSDFKNIQMCHSADKVFKFLPNLLSAVHMITMNHILKQSIKELVLVFLLLCKLDIFFLPCQHKVTITFGSSQIHHPHCHDKQST